jgi:cytochrome c-type biogenesis protein CcmH
MNPRSAFARTAVLSTLLVLLVAACGAPLAVAPPERRAQAIDQSLICPICPGETIDQSRTELAKQMRDVVREKLAAGWTGGQIQQFFVERYGPGVLAAPPRRGFNLVAWIVPPVAVLVGIVGLWLALRSLRGRSTDAPQPSANDANESLDQYLAQVDAALERSGSANDKRTDMKGHDPKP